MSCFLYADEDEKLKKINIDELYEKQKSRDLKQITIFNKILNRIHIRIKSVNRFGKKDKFVWFNIPEYIFGEPIYDNAECIAYIVSKLEENGFYIRYVHPNTLFISWENWIPTYVRNEIKKKRGIVIDEKGNVVKKEEEDTEEPVSEKTDKHVSTSVTQIDKKTGKEYTSIKSYKPTGNLVYSQEFFEKLEKKF
jgi:hypothetical protein